MKQKLVVTEKKTLCLVTNQSYRLNMENTDYHNYEARVNTKDLPIGWSCTFFKFCFETLMKENKMIVTELKGLYLLTNQTYKLIFGKPGLSDVLRQRSKWTTSRLDTFSLVKVFNWHLDEEKQYCSYEKHEFGNSDESFFCSVWKLRTIKILMEGFWIEFSIGISWTKGRFPIECLIEEIKPLGTEKSKFE